MLDGVEVDLVATEPLPVDAADLPDDEGPRNFVLAHRWALESASQLSIAVADRFGSTVTRADLMAAEPPALLACKFGALAGRPSARQSKRESDARDILELARVLMRDRLLSERYATAPFDLAELVRRNVERWMVDGATSFARLVNLGADASDERVEGSDVADVAALLFAALDGGA